MILFIKSCMPRSYDLSKFFKSYIIFVIWEVNHFLSVKKTHGFHTF